MIEGEPQANEALTSVQYSKVCFQYKLDNLSCFRMRVHVRNGLHVRNHLAW